MGISSPRCSKPQDDVVTADSSFPRAGEARLVALPASATTAVLPFKGPKYLKSPHSRCAVDVEKGNSIGR